MSRHDNLAVWAALLLEHPGSTSLFQTVLARPFVNTAEHAGMWVFQIADASEWGKYGLSTGTATETHP
jgi:hypothetical protein